MGLDLSRRVDAAGAAIYMLHDGTVTQQRAVEQLAHALGNRDKTHQVIVLSARDPEAEQIRDFYDLNATAFPYILIVADDDRILYSWSGPHLPTIDHLSFTIKSL